MTAQDSESKKTYYPAKIIEQCEQPILFIRKSWFVIFPAFIFVFILAFIFWLVVLLLNYFLPAVFETSFKNFIVVLGSIYYLILAIYLLISWVNYYFDIGIITSKRLIDIDQQNIFHRTISELPLVRIQDVKVDVKGIWASYLHFGNVFIETAGEAPNFIFHHIPNPYQVADKILKLYEQAKKNEAVELDQHRITE